MRLSEEYACTYRNIDMPLEERRQQGIPEQYDNRDTFTEEQIAYALKQAETGSEVREPLRSRHLGALELPRCEGLAITRTLWSFKA